MNNSVIIFAKNPEIGKAKTRIALEIGDERALDIYKELLSITSLVVNEVSATKHLFYTHFINTGDEWPNEYYNKHIQVEGDLGIRMKSAFTTVLQSSKKAIIIGSDCPSVTSEIIEAGFKALDNHDVVIGPTYDGGYYLLGMKTVLPELFDNMVFSTDTVYRDTVSRIQRLSLTYAELPQLNDVDYYKDWVNYKVIVD